MLYKLYFAQKLPISLEDAWEFFRLRQTSKKSPLRRLDSLLCITMRTKRCIKDKLSPTQSVLSPIFLLIG